MRELKFRAWSELKKKMCFWPDKTNVTFWKDGKLVYFDHDGGRLCLSLSEEMQYTGLKDKNGVDLDWWEGDLLGDGPKIMQVVFEDGCFWGQWTKHPESRVALSQLADWSEHIEKIGTIFEHPELLK